MSCGGGKISRSRSCIYPDPTAKGKACTGDSTQTQDCGTNKCPGKTTSNTVHKETLIFVIQER